MTKLVVGIITYKGRIKDALKLANKIKNKAEIIISHQDPDEKTFLCPKNIPKGIIYLTTPTKGISINRNNILSYLKSNYEKYKDKIFVMADDDIEYLDDFDKKITDAYSKHPHADVITFDAILREKLKTTKEGEHNCISICQVCSVQITYKIKSILDKNIWYDERFGAGAKIPEGEENIFLADCLKEGLICIHVKEPIVKITDITSGEKLTFKKLFYDKRKVFVRMFGYIEGHILWIMFIIKKSLIG